jgi:hypothetical protein
LVDRVLAAVLEHNSHDKPNKFLDQEIRWDTTLQKIAHCTVVDCGSSALKGDYVALQDAQGATKKVMAVSYSVHAVAPILSYNFSSI